MNIRGNLFKSPLPPAEVYSSSTTTNPNNTPWLLWTPGTDLSKSGLSTYEMSIGTTPCGSDFYAWTDMTNFTGSPANSLAYRYGSFYLATPLTEGVDYYFNLRSIDNLNQIGQPICKKFNYTSTGWQQRLYLKPINSDSEQQFGHSISGDGSTSTVIVGAPQESSGLKTIINGLTASTDKSAPNAGAVYVYRYTNTVGFQEAYLKAANADPQDFFGYRVAMWGDTIAVSAPFESSSQTTITNGSSASSDNSSPATGAVYIFKRNGSTWTQEAYIKPSNGKANDRFGTGLALHGDTLVVGSVGDDTIDTDSGAVYVYSRAGSTWSQEAYIKATNANSGYLFGGTLALENDTLAIGSFDEASSQTTITNGPTAPTDKSIYNSGAVYVYKRAGVSWTQEAYIKASNADANDQFGISISLSGNTLAVGSAKESSMDNTIVNGSTSSADNTYPQAGAVYVYKRAGTTWAQEAYIKAPNSLPYSKFGFSVSLNQNRLAVGAPNEYSAANAVANDSVIIDDSSSPYSGAAYIFERSGTTWSQKSYLKAVNSYPLLNFGAQVALSSVSLVVGVPSEDTSGTTVYSGHGANAHDASNQKMNSGAVYVFSQ